MKLNISYFLAGLMISSASAAEVDGIAADSAIGEKVMSKVSRKLQDNYYYSSWIGSSALKFDGCASIPMYEKDEGLRSNLVAKFKLCPNDSCGSCRNGGEYIVEMREFVETYQEALQEANQYECENARQSCEYSCQNGGGYQYNNNGNGNANYNNGGNYNGNYNNQNNNNNEEYCQYQCLVEQGKDYCVEGGENGGEQQDINEFAECQPMNEEGNGGGNNNYNYQGYYLGAYCTSSGVYAGVFTDSTCTNHAPSGTYEKYNYGYSLPSQPLVSATCMSCSANNYNNDGGNNNNNYNYNYNYDNNNNGVAEVCERLYEESIKCESNVAGSSYKDTSGCTMIHTILPQLNSAMNDITHFNKAKAAAWTFGVGFFALAGYLFLLHRKVSKQKAELEKTGYLSADNAVNA